MGNALQTAGVRPTSPRLHRGFGFIARMHLRRHFRGVRLAHAERLTHTDGPLIFYFNHASWWDPLLCVQVQRVLLRQRRHYAPMDAEALQQYGFFEHIGVFPVNVNTPRGAAQFLRAAEAILAHGDVLWVSPQGEFVDVRRRPIVLKHGLGALLHRLGSVSAIPLALEYTFWDQRLPEALINIGEPLIVSDGRSTPAHAWTGQLTQGLTAAEDELAELAMTRDAAHFRPLLDGARGTAGVYGVWQRVRAAMRGEQYSPDHVSKSPGTSLATSPASSPATRDTMSPSPVEVKH